MLKLFMLGCAMWAGHLLALRYPLRKTPSYRVPANERSSPNNGHPKTRLMLAKAAWESRAGALSRSAHVKVLSPIFCPNYRP
jgi:hypothetical protein